MSVLDRRDVHLHAAVTITSLVNGQGILGEKDKEICQYAAAFNAPNKTPTPEVYIRRAFAEMTEACIKEMRRHGLIRE